MNSPPNLLDLLWMIVAAAMVMMMQAGFCLLETGCSRAKNSINVAIKNLADFCVASLAFWAIGFGLMFGQSYHGVVGTSYFFVSDGTGHFFAFMFFQLVFCGTATTIISGAVAERIRFSGYLAIAIVTSVIFYPLFGHWAWGGIEGNEPGWLKRLGFIDFAGSSVVHSLGGWLSLAAVLVVGSRRGRFEKNSPPIHGHDLAMSTIGCLVLWFSWFGFNGGSTLAMNETVPKILINTNLAATAGGIVSLAIAWLQLRRACVSHCINGVLAGLVAITASCNLADPWQSVLIGSIAGAVSVYGTRWLERAKIDDVVGAIPVHAMAGAWGTLAVALVTDPLESGTGLTLVQQITIQTMGVLVCAAWGLGGGWCVFKTWNHYFPLRVSSEHEFIGLNVAEHGAYSETIDLLRSMEEHRSIGDFTKLVPVEPHTEVGQIAQEYNRVLSCVDVAIKTRDETVTALRHAEENYRGIFENCVEGIFQTSIDGKYLRVNHALANMYGYDSPTHLIESIADVGTQLYVDPRRRDEFKAILDEHGIVEGFESEIFKRDGSRIWISESARAVMLEDATIERYEGMVVDITEARKLEQLRREKDAADASNAAKSAFLACMSHEIRTPLNGVIGMLDLLSGTELTAKQSHQVKVARRSAGSLLTLINDLLDLSKIEAGKMELESMAFDLRDLVGEVVEMLSFRAHEKGIELYSEFEPSIARIVLGDPERIRQVLINLVNNALKFTSRGSVVIRIETGTHDKQCLKFSIKDTGIGIPEDSLPRLFSEFMQVDASTSRNFGGTGLGLSICKQLVELMHGEIGVESKSGIGSTFWFKIVLPETVPVAQTKEKLPAELEGKRILVIDDNQTNLDIIESMLSGWGLRTTVLMGPAGAIDELRTAIVGGDPYRLILIDQHMPEKNGLDLAEEMRAVWQYAQIPIVLLSSDGSVSTREAEAVAGLAAFLRKPVPEAKLFATVVDCLKQTQIQRRETLDSLECQPRFPLGRILLAEDNEINQAVAVQILEDAGWQVEVVENGELATIRLAEQDFDVVIMDCQMPVLDGFEATAAIRKLEAQGQQRWIAPIPIVALTANASEDDRRRCLSAGMTAYATKPIVVDQFLRTVLGCMTHTQSNMQSLAATEVAPAIDWEDLNQRCLKNEAMISKIGQMFLGRLKSDLQSISDSVGAGDHAETARLAHALRGSAANVSASEIYEWASKLENWGKTQSTSPADNLVATLRLAADRCVQEIENRCAVAT